MFLYQPSGLYLTLNRAYDPYSGRWLSRDPAGEFSGDSYGVINPTPPTTFANQIPGLASMLSPVGGNPDLSLGSVASVNLYAYVGGDPVNLVDPWGLGPFGGRPPGYWPGDTGAGQWGKNQGYGARTGKNIFHGLKQSCGGKGADDYSVNPDTGDVLDQNGESVGNLNDEPNPLEFAPLLLLPFPGNPIYGGL